MSKLNVPVEKIEAYLTHIKADYKTFQSRGNGTAIQDEIRDSMYNEFANGLRYEVGNSYIKVIKTMGSQTMVHSFIVNKQSAAKGKFAIGDILMAAGWSAPATNFARGSVYDESLDRVRWTGVV